MEDTSNHPTALKPMQQIKVFMNIQSPSRTASIISIDQTPQQDDLEYEEVKEDMIPQYNEQQRIMGSDHKESIQIREELMIKEDALNSTLRLWNNGPNLVNMTPSVLMPEKPKTSRKGLDEYGNPRFQKTLKNFMHLIQDTSPREFPLQKQGITPSGFKYGFNQKPSLIKTTSQKDRYQLIQKHLEKVINIKSLSKQLKSGPIMESIGLQCSQPSQSNFYSKQSRQSIMKQSSIEQLPLNVLKGQLQELKEESTINSNKRATALVKKSIEHTMWDKWKDVTSSRGSACSNEDISHHSEDEGGQTPIYYKQKAKGTIKDFKLINKAIPIAQARNSKTAMHNPQYIRASQTSWQQYYPTGPKQKPIPVRYNSKSQTRQLPQTAFQPNAMMVVENAFEDAPRFSSPCGHRVNSLCSCSSNGLALLSASNQYSNHIEAFVNSKRAIEEKSRFLHSRSPRRQLQCMTGLDQIDFSAIMDLQRNKTPSSCSISRYQRNTFNNTASLMDPFAKLRLLHLTQNDTSPRQLTEPTPQHQSQQQRPSTKVQQLKDRLRALSQLNRGSNVSQLHEQRKAKYDNLLTSMFRVKKQTNMLPQVNNNNVKK